MHTTGRIVKFIQELYAFLKTGKDREFSLERIFAEEQIEYGVIVHLATLPIGISHSDLI